MRRLATSLLALAAVCLALGVSASSALAGYYGKVWLNWGSVSAGQITWSGFTYLKQVGTQPKSYNAGCGNQWDGYKYIWSQWYCAPPQYSVNSPLLGGGGYYTEPVAWNDSGAGQQLWAWEYYYA